MVGFKKYHLCEHIALDANGLVNGGFVVQLGTNTANNEAQRGKAKRPLKRKQWSVPEKRKGDNDKEKGDNVPTARPWCVAEKSFRMELGGRSGWLCLLRRRDIQPASSDSSGCSSWSVAIDHLISVCICSRTAESLGSVWRHSRPRLLPPAYTATQASGGHFQESWESFVQHNTRKQLPIIQPERSGPSLTGRSN